jgi:hypothetical protein
MDMAIAHTTPSIRSVGRNRNRTFAIDALTALGLIALMFIAAVEMVYWLTDLEPAATASISKQSGQFQIPEVGPILTPPL